MNRVKLLGDDRMAELYCLLVVEVLELPLEEIEYKYVYLVDCEELVKVQKFEVHDE